MSTKQKITVRQVGRTVILMMPQESGKPKQETFTAAEKEKREELKELVTAWNKRPSKAKMDKILNVVHGKSKAEKEEALVAKKQKKQEKKKVKREVKSLAEKNDSQTELLKMIEQQGESIAAIQKENSSRLDELAENQKKLMLLINKNADVDKNKPAPVVGRRFRDEH